MSRSGARVGHLALCAVACGAGEVLACFVYLGSKPATC